MDQKTIIVIVAVILTAVICTIASKVFKNQLLKRMLQDLQKQDFDDYYHTIDSVFSKFFFPAFNREYMRMNGLVMQGNQKRVEEQFDLMLNMRLSKKQEIDIVMKAFYYYLEDGNQKKSKQLLERVRKFGDDYFKESEIMYNVCIEKTTKYIDEMEAALKDPECKDQNRGMFLYMLALQYGNAGQKKKMKDYLHEAQGLLKNTPYELKIRALLQ